MKERLHPLQLQLLIINDDNFYQGGNHIAVPCAGSTGHWVSSLHWMHPAPLLLGLQKIGAGPFGFGPPALGAMFKELATLVHVFQIQYLFRGRHVIKTCLFQQIRLVCNLALLGRSNNLIGMGGGETKYEIMINNCEFVGYKGNCM